ncbi:ABC transporter G family member, partial [Lachnellula hyalina]
HVTITFDVNISTGTRRLSAASAWVFSLPPPPSKPAPDECFPRVHLVNHIVKTFGWKDMNVTIKDHMTKAPLSILTDANGLVRAGEMIAIMGPSGSGKTTLLNTLAHRAAAAGASTYGDTPTNGQVVNWQTLRHLSAYVEQEDALIGSLTVCETMKFAASLALPGRVEDLLGSFGMNAQANTIVGTPIKKGLSGGQKKRLGVASRLVTDPKILFLDEPTSGLDSALSFEVMNYIKQIGRRNNKYVFHYINYQAYVFQGMMVNEFERRDFDCAGSAAAGYSCMYQSDLASVGKIRGTTILAQFGYRTGLQGEWLGIMIGIIAGYRILGWVVLVIKKT